MKHKSCYTNYVQEDCRYAIKNNQIWYARVLRPVASNNWDNSFVNIFEYGVLKQSNNGSFKCEPKSNVSHAPIAHFNSYCRHKKCTLLWDEVQILTNK